MSFSHDMPLTLRAGDAASWSAACADYPASDGWLLAYALVREGSRHLVPTTADGDGWAVPVLSSVSDKWAAGDYKWVAYVSKDGARHTLADGTVLVLPDLAAASGGMDTRTTAAVILEAVENVLRGVATHAQESKQVSTSAGTMALKFVPRAELLVMRSQFRAELEAERVEERLNNGQPGGRRILARIGR